MTDTRNLDKLCRPDVFVTSSEISKAILRTSIPWHLHLYGIPFLSLYPVLVYAYYFKYDNWLQSEEWTFLACVSLAAGHALSFLVTRWSTAARAWITTKKVRISSPFTFTIPTKWCPRPLLFKTLIAYV
jgi:cation-transporting ATPase 13A1